MTVMIIIAASAFVLRFGIGGLIALTVSQNESYASVTLKLISAALENYAKDHQGMYPSRFLPLTASNPPYVDQDYISQSPVRGYSYECPRLDPSGYRCSAVPLNCKLTGSRKFSVTTGGILISDACDQTES